MVQQMFVLQKKILENETFCTGIAYKTNSFATFYTVV